MAPVNLQRWFEDGEKASPTSHPNPTGLFQCRNSKHGFTTMTAAWAGVSKEVTSCLTHQQPSLRVGCVYVPWFSGGCKLSVGSPNGTCWKLQKILKIFLFFFGRGTTAVKP